jgi:hypothetical protein
VQGSNDSNRIDIFVFANDAAGGDGRAWTTWARAPAARRCSA